MIYYIRWMLLGMASRWLQEAPEERFLQNYAKVTWGALFSHKQFILGECALVLSMAPRLHRVFPKAGQCSR